MATTWAHAVYSKESYAPFGETYDEAGTADRSFTGQDQDTVTGSGGTGIYDYLFRKYDPSAGRWLSPDPAGWSVVNQADPQSLDRYAYVENHPMSYTDPSGLCPQVTYYFQGNTLVGISIGDDGTGPCFIGPVDLTGGSFPSGLAGGGGTGSSQQTNNSMGNGEVASNNGCFTPNWLQQKGIALQQKVAEKLGHPFGFGAGISAGAGFGWGFGFAGTASGQMIVTPSGNAYLVYTYGGSGSTTHWLTVQTKGLGVTGGLQASSTTAQNPSSLAGPAVDAALGGGDGWGGGGDLSYGGDFQLTGTGGFGFGGFGGARVLTQTKVIPSCSNHP